MSRPTRTAQLLAVFKGRTVAVFAAVSFAYLLLAGRLIYLQAARHSYFQREADTYRVSKSQLLAGRGIITDRNGDLLAMNVPASAVYADPVAVTDIQGESAKLAVVLGDDPARIAKLLSPSVEASGRRSRYVSLKRHAPVEVGQTVQALTLPGIGVAPDTRRSYPNGTMAAQILGFTNRDGDGIEGLERSQDASLCGKDGIEVAEIDRAGRFLPGTERRRREPENGADLTLTIDRNLQQAADAAITKDVADHHARNGVVVIMDPSNGEILALANAPGYDPNAPRPNGPVSKDEATALAGHWRDDAVSDLYEPGSTLKTITASAVLQEEGPSALNTHVYCSGQMQIGNHVIHCAKDPPYYGVHGDETLRGVLKESCNIGIAQFALHLGSEKLYKYEQAFGLLDYADSGLPGEARTRLQDPSQFNHFTGSVGWSSIQLANIAFGQGISVTPLQLTAAYCAIANGGTLYRPHIVKRVTKDGVAKDIAPEAVRKVLDPQVAAEVRSLLGTVVQEGTGQPAQIAGFSVGGKTGSAQVSGPRGYEEGHYVASFIGMAPLSHPRVVILCAVFEPQGVHWGATVAAPVVHDLTKIAMREMAVDPDAPDAVDWKDHLKAKHRSDKSTGDAAVPQGVQIHEL